MGFNYKWTCPGIDKNIVEIKGEIYNFFEDMLRCLQLTDLVI